MADYLVTYRFEGLTREQVESLVGEIQEETGLEPESVEEVEK